MQTKIEFILEVWDVTSFIFSGSYAIQALPRIGDYIDNWVYGRCKVVAVTYVEDFESNFKIIVKTIKDN